MGSRPRMSSACSSLSRRSPRLRSLPQLRKPLKQNLRKTQMPRRRRRRRRRPPSKCHPLTVEAVEKCSKHSFYLRALKITVIRIHLTVSNSCCAATLCIIQQRPSPYYATKKITKKEELRKKKNSEKKKKKKKKKFLCVDTPL